jgi:hypothetical protein
LQVHGARGTLRRLEVIEMLEVSRDDPHEVVIRVSGTFDGRLGAELSRCLGEAGAAARVLVDFCHLRPLLDADLCDLVTPLSGVANLSIHGLCRHHLRLLRYCGVRLAAARPDGDWEREG